jgi:RNA polymerase sigma-70 factor (ECF subfamily)
MAVTADAEIVARCRRGDASAMRELVERFQGDVFGVCRRVLRHAQDSEDVAQEVFLRVFRSLHRWDGHRPLKPWILAIAVNRCRTAIGQRAKRPETVDYLESSEAAAPPDDSRELSEGIRDAVDGLRQEFREVFTLFHEQGQTYEEISEAVDRPVGTVKTWLHRARAEVLEFVKSRGLIAKAIGDKT